jgi:D,D-heptose 1,7-bisphosphate phosphatase
MSRKRAVFLDRDGVINKEKKFILNPEEFEFIEKSPEAIRIINNSCFLAFVVTNQSAVARNLITLQELEQIHEKLREELKIQGAYLDAIYYCPHHPDYDTAKGNPEFIKDCNCRKPKPGMLIEAAKKHNIDLTQSYMIGDSGRDIEAGQKAGCTTIGVHTGKDITTSEVQPDFVFDNLFDAVEFILGK